MARLAREATTKRLDLDPGVVERAKRAFLLRDGKSPDDTPLEDVYFRRMLDVAVEEFLPKIIEALDKIGLRKTRIKKQQRPVSIRTWDQLREAAGQYDVSRVQLVRAALELMARSRG